MSGALYVAGLILLMSAAAGSQTGDWTVYDTANSGLPYNGVTALAIDAQGIVWVGTGRWYAFVGGGLARFDGQNWTVYNTSNSALPNNDHVGLSIDPQGNIWSGTEGGLSKFDGENWTVYRTSNSGLPDNQVGAPVFDAAGNGWMGTSEGLVKFDGTTWTVYTTGNSGLPDNFIWPVLLDAQGNLWVGTFSGGLAKFDGADWTVYNASNSGLPNNTLTSLAVDSQRNVWIGTYGGVARFDGAGWKTYNPSNSELPHNRVWNLTVDAQGGVWAATNGGLARFDGTSWTVYNTSNSGLPGNNVYSVAIDAEGSVWIGTENGGLAVFRPRAVVDFNGDGIVNIKDLLRLIESWGQEDPLVDIGPTALGDGIVDAADLEVLMSHWQREVDDPTLVAYWALDETEGSLAFDSAGSNDGTVTGVPLWQPAGGVVDGALEFDGATFVAAGLVLDPQEGPFSVFAWVKGGAPRQAIVSQEAGANWLMADPLDANLMTALRAGGRSPKNLLSQARITDGGWHRIGFAWDGTSRRLYADDVLVAEDAQIALEGSVGDQMIGCGADMTAGTFWAGLIDDVRIYNRAVRP
jgi:sugar lactone lactonase YvrE